MARSLLRDSCPRLLEDRESRTGPIEQGLNNDSRHPDAFDIECVGSSGREVEDAPASVQTPMDLHWTDQISRCGASTRGYRTGLIYAAQRPSERSVADSNAAATGLPQDQHRSEYRSFAVTRNADTA